MSKKKQKPILSDKIAELIAPRRLLDPEIDSEDETAARAIDYELDEEFEPLSALSDIRKKNVKLLQDVDAKYRGKVSSRKEIDMDSSDSEESGENGIDEFSMTLTPRQKNKLAQEADGSEDENQIESAASSDDEEDLKSFASKLNKSNGNGAASDSEEDMDLNDSPTELDKWDDDYEGEEIEEENDSEEEQGENEQGSDEENSDVDEGDEFDSDEEESDFDGGDIMQNATVSDEKVAQAKPDLSRILPKQRSDDQQNKGACVQNQLQVWEKLLEVRIHSQKMLIKANSLPQPAKFKQLANENADFVELANDTENNLFKLASQMRDLQTLLMKQFSETKEIGLKRKSVSSSGAPEAKRSRLADQLEKDYTNFKDYQYSVISKWHDRTKVLTPGSVKTQRQQGNIDVLRKIEGVLANREELIKKSQLLKGGYQLFDQQTGIVEQKQIKPTAASDEEESANNSGEHVYSVEVYDDSDFYHTQLRELIEYKTSASSTGNEMAKQLSELQKLRKKMKKEVDTRASKGRKIRYVVHNKLLSFMAPNDTGNWNADQKDELFKSLFGAQL